jgi:predicted transcriptional regulator
MARTIIPLPDDKAEALERTAKQRGISKAAVVRQALADLLERQRRDALVERALAAAGTGASGVPGDRWNVATLPAACAPLSRSTTTSGL